MAQFACVSEMITEPECRSAL